MPPARRRGWEEGCVTSDATAAFRPGRLVTRAVSGPPSVRPQGPRHPPPKGRLVLVTPPQLPAPAQGLVRQAALPLDPRAPGPGAERAAEHAAGGPSADVAPALAARTDAVFVEQGQ